MKRIFKVILAGVCLGIVFILIKVGFRMDDASFTKLYWIAAVVIVVGAVVINFIYSLSYQKKLQKINLCLCYFDLDQTEKGLKVYDENQPLFNMYRKSKLYGTSESE